jgi:HPt (histidine-containing phosphotransfer) domain-containing protein
MNDYIAKPVDDKLLYSKIIAFVKKNMRLNEHTDLLKDENIRIKCTNMDFLKLHTKSNKALMMEMISLYLEQTPPLIRTMKQSSYSNDWNLLSTTIHKLIPSFSIVGINADFENMAKKVQEYAGTQQQTDRIYDLVKQLESVCNQACIELEEELKIIKKSPK